MADVYNIELTVKSEKTSDATSSSEATYLEEKFSLYARYNFKVGASEYSSITLVNDLFKDKTIISTGAHTITEITNINEISEQDIQDAIDADYEVKFNQICGEATVTAKLFKIFHADLPYKISDGRESTYTVL